MSLLYRTGNGRNNIAWGGVSTTSGKYCKRTGTSRNSIRWYNTILLVSLLHGPEHIHYQLLYLYHQDVVI